MKSKSTNSTRLLHLSEHKWYFKKLFLFFLISSLFSSLSLSAQIFFDGSPGTNAPPVTLGAYTMVPFGDDSRALGVLYSSVPLPAPLSGNLEFTPLAHYKIGDGWATWSHGYSGSVYYTEGSAVMTFTLPVKTRAFYFYAQPNNFSTFTIEAIGETGSKSATISSGPISVDGSGGAKYFGFYTDGVAEIAEIVVTTQSGASGFAVGEFGIFCDNTPAAVPLSNWALYFGILLMVVFVAIRFRRMA